MGTLLEMNDVNGRRQQASKLIVDQVAKGKSNDRPLKKSFSRADRVVSIGEHALETGRDLYVR
jgi:hypothetical protein